MRNFAPVVLPSGGKVGWPLGLSGYFTDDHCSDWRNANMYLCSYCIKYYKIKTTIECPLSEIIQIVVYSTFWGDRRYLEFHASSPTPRPLQCWLLWFQRKISTSSTSAEGKEGELDPWKLIPHLRFRRNVPLVSLPHLEILSKAEVVGQIQDEVRATMRLPKMFMENVIKRFPMLQ